MYRAFLGKIPNVGDHLLLSTSVELYPDRFIRSTHVQPTTAILSIHTDDCRKHLSNANITTVDHMI